MSVPAQRGLVPVLGEARLPKIAPESDLYVYFSKKNQIYVFDFLGEWSQNMILDNY